MTDRVEQILRELKVKLAELYGERLEKLILFGSQARGDAEPDSDIDVLVVLRGDDDVPAEDERCTDIVVDMNLKYGLLVSLVHMSSRQYHSRKSPLLLNVRREGIAL
ncbi:MAG: nucleotidyltransferase domain-containing protein [bacterium]|nr:nucleotidyltransferase domain-containing protein [bacterium]